MNITTKFGIGDEVYVLFKEPNSLWVSVFTDEIMELAITKKGVVYYPSKIIDEFTEDLLLPIGCNTNELVDKINELLKEDEENGIES